MSRHALFGKSNLKWFDLERKHIGHVGPLSAVLCYETSKCEIKNPIQFGVLSKHRLAYDGVSAPNSMQFDAPISTLPE